MKRYSLFITALFFTVVTFAQTSFQMLTEKGYAELAEGHVQEAKRSFEQAKKLLPEKFGTEEKAGFYNDLGVVYYQSGDYKKGIDAYKQSLKLYKQLSNDSLIAGELLNLGLAYKEIGLFELAIKELTQSARLSEQYGSQQELSAAWNAIGNIQRELKNFEKALYYHRKALNIRMKIGYEKGIADSYHNLGYIYLEQKCYDKAAFYLEKALKRKRKLNNQSYLVTTLTLLGEVYDNQKKPEKALNCLNKAYALRMGLGNSPKAAFSLFYLGSFYAKHNEHKKAFEAYCLAEVLARSSHDLRLLVNVLQGEIALAETRRNKELTVQKYQELWQTQQLIAKDENKKEITRLEIEYDVERKNHELESRRKQSKLDKADLENQQLKNQRLFFLLLVVMAVVVIITISWYRIRSSKKRIVLQKQQITYLHRELSHRTKNYFGLLSGILQSDREKVQHEAAALKIIDENVLRLEAMALVQRLLSNDHLVNGKLQVDLYLSELTELLLLHLQSNNPVSTHLELTPVLLDYDRAMRLGIILNELICNAIEHGLRLVEKPELIICLQHERNVLKLVVTDNGPGIPDALKDSSNPKGIGLMNALLHNINGNISYYNDGGCVATVIIEL